MWKHPAATINISIVNQSSVIDQTQAQAAASAIQKQITRDFFPAWGVNANIFMTPQGAQVPAGYWQIAILDDSDQAGALGYHDLTNDGQPLGKIFAKTDMDYNLSWTVTLSHEVLEMIEDPWIDSTTFDQVSATTGRLYAKEVADACEADEYGYDIDGIKVSDFVYPAWFNSWRAPNSTKFDHMGHITSPLQILNGGYIGYFDVTSGRGWQQLFSEEYPRRSVGQAAQGKSRFVKRRNSRDVWMKSKI